MTVIEDVGEVERGKLEGVAGKHAPADRHK